MKMDGDLSISNSMMRGVNNIDEDGEGGRDDHLSICNSVMRGVGVVSESRLQRKCFLTGAWLCP